MRWLTTLAGLIALTALIGLQATVQAQAQALAPTQAQTQAAPAAFHEAWQLLEDLEGTLTLQEVQQRMADFRPHAAAVPLRNPGYTRAALWARLDLPPPTHDETWWLMMTLRRVELAQVWLDAGAGQWRLLAEAGLQVPHRQWPMDSASPIFEVQREAGQPLRLLLRTAGRNGGAFDAVLCRPRECHEDERYIHLAIWVLAGNQMLAAVAYLLMCALWRKGAFALMAAAMAVYGLYELSVHGQAFQYLWPNATDWTQRSLLVLMGMAQLLQSLSVASILPLRQAPRLLQLTLAGVWLALVVALSLAAWGDYRSVAPLINAASGLCALLTLGFTAWAFRRRLPLAGWTGLIMLGSVLGALPRYAYVLGLLKMGPAIPLTTPTVFLLSHLILLGALVKRSAQMRQAELEAQAQLLQERAARGRELEQQVAERTAQLSEALHDASQLHQQRSRLLAYIGHDLRAPLAATVSYLRLLDGRSPRDHQLRASVEQGVAYQLALIDELVEFSRGELHELDLVPAPLYLHGLLRELAEQGELLAGQRHNRFLANIAPELPPVVLADAKRLRQLLLNLLSNAAKFTTEGRIELSVQPAAAPQAWRFEVTDSGCGIGAEDQARVFEPFWRAPPQEGELHGRPGSGLGLAVARHIVEAMGGQLTLHSAPGEGSRFAFELVLPIGRAEDVLLPNEGSGHADAFATDLPPGLMALVIDAPLAHADRVVELLFAANADVQRLSPDADLSSAELLLCDPALLEAQALARIRAWRAASGARRCIALLDRPLAPELAELFDAQLYKPVSAAALLAGLLCLPGRAAAAGVN